MLSHSVGLAQSSTFFDFTPYGWLAYKCLGNLRLPTSGFQRTTFEVWFVANHKCGFQSNAVTQPGPLTNFPSLRPNACKSGNEIGGGRSFWTRRIVNNFAPISMCFLSVQGTDDQRLGESDLFITMITHGITPVCMQCNSNLCAWHNLPPDLQNDKKI